MTFNEEKSIFSTDTLTLFGSVISKGTIKPDPERLRPLKELPPPQNIAAQRRVIGMFSYASVNSKHQHPPLATPGVLHSTAAPGPGFILDDLPRGPGFCISIKLRLVQ